ncbi:NUDIX domain-containing protein [Salinispora arenicola]|uniref:NUDIX domain-containing protein n=1 Tax=Salinispora arenicola TaxID=168697 RepID=UPI001E3E1728|nr:NUDIX hydrolase [Salinispora arenicola]
MPPVATPRVAAGALFLNNEGHVLLVHPSYKKHWDIPGGYVEPGESPRAACIREVEERTRPHNPNRPDAARGLGTRRERR